MTEDLVRRLRAWAECDPNALLEGASSDLFMAADRIEELEVAYNETCDSKLKAITAMASRIEELERERDIANAAVVLQEGLLQTLRGLVRNEALEEAASVAEHNAKGPYDNLADMFRAGVSSEIAAAIRALKEESDE